MNPIYPLKRPVDIERGGTHQSDGYRPFQLVHMSVIEVEGLDQSQK